MKFSDLIKKRYSVRAYKSDPIPDAEVQAILEDACLAPTAANRQAFQIIVIKTKGHEQELKRIYNRDWFTQPPLVIAIVGLTTESWVRRGDNKNYCDVDAAIVMDHLILSAADHNLGTCWVGAFDRDSAVEVLGLPENVEPIAFTPLGYAEDTAPPKKRKPIDSLVRYERW